MLILLDARAFIWWMPGDASPSSQARGVIADPASQIFASAANARD